MLLFINIASNLINKTEIFVFDQTKTINIDLEDLDMIDFELETDVLYNEYDTKLIIGSTPYNLEIADKKNNKFYYKLSRNNNNIFFSGNFSSHISKQLYRTKSGLRRFTRLLLNEIGLCKIYLSHQNVEQYLGSITVSSKKITQNDDNFKIITEYLLYQGYFDSKYLYKSILDGQRSTLSNSLLEALRKLVWFLERWRKTLNRFKEDAVTVLSNRNVIQNYDNNQTIGIESIDWLVDNLNAFIPTTRRDQDITISKKPYRIERILINENNTNYDSYENRIIHGFISNLLKIITSKQSLLEFNQTTRTKITSFRELLIYCFNQLLEKNFFDAKYELLNINNFFKSNLPVTTPIYEYPKKIDGFYSKPHYKQVIELINYTKNLFSIEFGLDNLNLEIESFDRLFEVYCFYLIKDIISNVFYGGKIKDEALKNASLSNNLSGCYSFISENFPIKIQLYYEYNPTDFIQVSNSFYLPDFVIALTKNDNTGYIIFDAKYKNYTDKTLDMDISILTLKYLHKIKLRNDSKSRIIGLFPLSLSDNNKRGSIFKKEYYLNNSIIPQIGNIELDPKSLNLEKNNIVDILNFALSTL